LYKEAAGPVFSHLSCKYTSTTVFFSGQKVAPVSQKNSKKGVFWRSLWGFQKTFVCVFFVCI
jgi:hypothetical protein